MTVPPTDIRWLQRLEHLDRALALLDSVAVRPAGTLTEVEQAGGIQFFEVTLELAWKTLKDYLEWSGLEVVPASPREVVRVATAARVIDDGQVWLEMLAQRNLAAHTYDANVVAQTLTMLRERFLPALRSAHDLLHAARAELDR